jgi:hypothetical protein
MRRRSTLEALLGGVFGGVLGGIITVALMFLGIGHRLVVLPLVLGAFAGLWKGDRALFLMMKVVGWFPG